MTQQTAREEVELYNAEYKQLSEEEAKAGYPDCKICGNKRYTAQICHNDEFDYWFSNYSPCCCKDIIRSIDNLNKSGLSELVRNFRFDNFIIKHTWQNNMKEAVITFGKNIINGGTNWLLVLGQSGSGKTHICTAACGTLLNKGYAVKYFRWSVEGKRIKAMANSPEYSTEIDKIMLNDIIYIDDLFKRKKGAEVTDGDIKLAFELVDTAFAERKILIVSGEDCLSDLYKVDQAIAGRLKQNACQNIIELFGGEKNQRL